MTRRFVLYTNRGCWCVEDLHRRTTVEGTCVSAKYPANKRAVERYRDRMNEEWEARNGHGTEDGGQRD